jgi:nucleoside-diphosphate-sugar epimerase
MAIEGKKILITGGSGFIGSTLARRLADANEIVLFDTGHRRTSDFDELLARPSVRLITGDVMDYEAVCAAMKGCTIIIHMASIAGVDTVLSMPVQTMKVSLLGTYNVLEAAKAQGDIERLIDFSTSEVFGSYAYNVQEGDVTSLGPVGEARWTYAVSKLATEHLAHNYYREFGLPTLSIRPFNIYGPRQVGEGAIRRFVLNALAGTDLEIHNDGTQVRAWCYIDDIVDAIELCLERPQAVGQAFNIGSPRSVCTIYELACKVQRLSGGKVGIRFTPRNATDVELRVPNIKKAKELLGFEPKVELEDGILRTLDWFRTAGG